MFLAPKPGHQYRDTRSKQLVPIVGFEADVCDLDIVRARECGDLVEVRAPKAKPAPKA